MSRRIVVVGGDAAGATAASTAKRHAPDDPEVVVLERTGDTSYSACGIPYWIGGEVGSRDALVARSPEQHRAAGIDVRTGTEATAVDLERRTVSFRVDDGTTGEISYDDLVVATGARPIRPALPGIDAAGVHGVQTLADGAALLDDLERSGARRAVVVGAGYIGVEMAEAMLRRGLAVTVVDRSPEPFTTLDPDLGVAVREAMTGLGITVLTETSVTGFEVDDGVTGDRGGASGRVAAVRTGDGALAADVVVLGLGVRPEVDLARAAGLPVGQAGGLVVEPSMRVVGHEHVWAGGDCVENRHRLTGRGVAIALGTHANKHGRVIGFGLAGQEATFPGVVGTAISKVCDLEIGRTGLGEREAAAAGFDAVAASIDSTTTAGYFPGAAPLTVKVVVERGTTRLLGAQIVGRVGSAKRIDVFATALWAGMTADDLAFADLSYAPPFSPTWDAVLVAARQGALRARA